MIASPVLACTPAQVSGSWGATSWCGNMSYNIGAYDYANTVENTANPDDGVYFGLWEGTNNTNNLTNWIYVGYEMPSDSYSSTGTYMWADLRPNSTYYWHSLSSGPSTGTSHAYEVQYLGNDEWGVYIDFNQVGTSTSNPPGSYSALAGAWDPGYQGMMGSFSDQTNQSLEYLADGAWYSWSGGSIIADYPLSAWYTNGYANEADSES